MEDDELGFVGQRREINGRREFGSEGWSLLVAGDCTRTEVPTPTTKKSLIPTTDFTSTSVTSYDGDMRLDPKMSHLQRVNLIVYSRVT